MFARILIANRGVIASRVIRACKALNVQSVAVYSSVDASAPYLQEADACYELPGYLPKETYLNAERILAIAKQAKVDGLHPGYGFLSENAEFAQTVINAGLGFIGPSPTWLTRMADKVVARRLMSELGFPTFPGSNIVADIEQARQVGRQLGYPLMLKPVNGGGGIGMQVVHDATELAVAFRQSSQVAAQNFGQNDIFLERWIAQPRHVELQMLADQNGGVMHMHERDCSIQRRNQKVIEEAPAPGLPRTEMRRLANQAQAAIQALGYDNVGTVETLRDTKGNYGFLEMNTRIQVEHGVTEEVTGVDLVCTQIELAAGGRLPEQPVINGHAVQARIYAEDPVSMLPSTGQLVRFEPPKMRHVRVEVGYQQDQIITPYYDPLIAKLIAWGQTREQAIGRLLVGLKAFVVVGVSTNIPLLQRVLQDERFISGQVHTGLLVEILDS